MFAGLFMLKINAKLIFYTSTSAVNCVLTHHPPGRSLQLVLRSGQKRLLGATVCINLATAAYVLGEDCYFTPKTDKRHGGDVEAVYASEFATAAGSDSG
ncbi:hypothetical protein GDO81_006568 [Engystomops pustulosus]|uniref:Uncharacterized protein n=1 Tax=Engystomops pustulosus TaxID=76066 RepID=A0AAV7CXR6_ENGPU|nr:hypothetical protein GDO81_006568 [Engystomops pustulosus]